MSPATSLCKKTELNKHVSPTWTPTLEARWRGNTQPIVQTRFLEAGVHVFRAVDTLPTGTTLTTVTSRSIKTRSMHTRVRDASILIILAVCSLKSNFTVAHVLISRHGALCRVQTRVIVAGTHRTLAVSTTESLGTRASVVADAVNAVAFVLARVCETIVLVNFTVFTNKPILANAGVTARRVNTLPCSVSIAFPL